MSILTKYSGNWIVNGEPFELEDGVTIVSYRNDATVESFDSAEAMLAAHKEQFPEYYIELQTL